MRHRAIALIVRMETPFAKRFNVAATRRLGTFHRKDPRPNDHLTFFPRKPQSTTKDGIAGRSRRLSGMAEKVARTLRKERALSPAWKTLARLENLRKERLGFPRGKLLEERVPHLLRRHGIDGLKGRHHATCRTSATCRRYRYCRRRWHSTPWIGDRRSRSDAGSARDTCTLCRT